MSGSKDHNSKRLWLTTTLTWLTICWSASVSVTRAAEMEWVRVADDQRGFVLATSKQPFRPWGFNYDHDRDSRLLEDYWDAEWKTVEEDFREMRELGANVVRVHLQFGKFMRNAREPNDAALRQLKRLVALAEATGLYLDVTGLGCYHKADVPAWYDALDEADRWEAQAKFWEAVAVTCAASPAIFCYDLMNEPVAPAGTAKGKDWLGPAFGGKHFVQWISRELAGRERHDVARSWIQRLTRAIRKHDQRHLVTVGLVPWSLARPGLQSGFVPQKIVDDVDFIAVHLYPKTGKVDEALETLRGFAVGKPVVIEETFSLEATPEELGNFLDQSRGAASGWVGFYWGKTEAEYARGGTIADAITAAWLKLFRENTARMRDAK